MGMTKRDREWKEEEKKYKGEKGRHLTLEMGERKIHKKLRKKLQKKYQWKEVVSAKTLEDRATDVVECLDLAIDACEQLVVLSWAILSLVMLRRGVNKVESRTIALTAAR